MEVLAVQQFWANQDTLASELQALQKRLVRVYWQVRGLNIWCRLAVLFGMCCFIVPGGVVVCHNILIVDCSDWILVLQDSAVCRPSVIHCMYLFFAQTIYRWRGAQRIGALAQALTDVALPAPCLSTDAGDADFATALADDSSFVLVNGQFPATNMTHFTQVRFYVFFFNSTRVSGFCAVFLYVPRPSAQNFNVPQSKAG